MIPWKHKDLIALNLLEKEEIEIILNTTKVFKEVLSRPVKKVPSLRGKTVVNLFVEPSTRTRISFELAAKRLSADVISLDSAVSSFKKGESLKDTAQNLQAMGVDFIVLRHPSPGAANLLSQYLHAHVINAGDGPHEHPTQGLLDIFTIREHFQKVEGLKVVIVGDIIHSRVARSNIWGLTKLGARVTLAGPSTLLPNVFKDLGVEVSHCLDSALEGADVVNLLRIQHERQQTPLLPSLGEYISTFALTSQRLKLCKPNVLVMHPGPINRGVEIDNSVANAPSSAILDQVTHGVAVRMAVLHLLNGGSI